jgi:hypothetical protein
MIYVDRGNFLCILLRLVSISSQKLAGFLFALDGLSLIKSVNYINSPNRFIGIASETGIEVWILLVRYVGVVDIPVLQYAIFDCKQTVPPCRNEYWTAACSLEMPERFLRSASFHNVRSDLACQYSNGR